MGFQTVISDDGVYRYSLTREIDGLGEKECLFIMLNPSTADATLNDPTITRCMGFASRWGYRELWVVNLFAYRATDPDDLVDALDPVGFESDGYISEMARCADLVVCAWGTNGAFVSPNGHRRDRYIKEFLEVRHVRPYHLGLTKHGFPKHPLYIRADTQPQEWK